ncbi:MAG TPA: VWA domain-containing protein [Pseudolabrys sp.]|jgi:Flp pilus assembly protein TadG|nr:VWA domain-containing protein [Pseudolabrys sp.]
MGEPLLGRLFPQHWVSRMLARFLTNARGGVAPLMAVVAVPVMAAVGMAVDYSRVNAARTAFQVSLDATALMLSKDAATETSKALQTEATKTFNSLFSRPEVTDVNVTPLYTSAGGSKLTLNGTAVVHTNFLGVIGIDHVDIKSLSVSSWGNTRLRVALVLDNTGSMASDGKMDALKTASHNLLTQLQQAAVHPEDVYVSIVPFSKDVNFGSSNYAQSWLRWDLWEEVNGSCSNTSYSNRTSCQSHSKVWTPAAHNTWNGCVTDRDQNFDTTNSAAAVGSTQYPTEQYSSCSASLIPLTNDWTALNAKIDTMVPVGNTNQAIGLQVGWQTLTATPFTVPPVDPDYKYQTVIILLTDGLNTQDRWYTSQSSINTRQQKTCNNIKDAGLTVYTVQVNTGGDATSTLLQNCASDPGKFFLLTSAGQIVATFGQIGTSLSKLRLAM